MKKIKKMFRENKVISFLMLILLICFIFIIVLLFKYFYSGASRSKYGDRLEEIENYPLSETLEQDIKDIYKDNDSVGDIKINVQGRLIYITIDFVKAIKLSDAKSLAVKALDAIEEENKSFYDIQFTLTAKSLEDQTSFPTQGYKNAKSLKISWIKS